RGDAARQRTARAQRQVGRAGLALFEDPLLLRDDALQVHGRPHRTLLAAQRIALLAAQRIALLAAQRTTLFATQRIALLAAQSSALVAACRDVLLTGHNAPWD